MNQDQLGSDGRLMFFSLVPILMHMVLTVLVRLFRREEVDCEGKRSVVLVVVGMYIGSSGACSRPSMRFSLVSILLLFL